jgi:hypothetical protein
MGKSILFFLVIFVAGCAARWEAFPKNVPIERRCQTLKSFPQMVEIPGFINAWQLVYNCNAHPAEKTSIAMSTFLKEWEESFGKTRRVRDNLNTILISWSKEMKKGNGYGEDGNYIHNANFSGLTITKGTVWVKVRDAERICESSLAHELAHASIWSIKGTDGDPDHLGRKYHGWTIETSLVVQRTNDKLCRLGI